MSQKKIQNNRELWQTIQKWLSLLGNNPNTQFCREEITAHVDYPAMTAITDFLDTGNMQYQAVQADASYINEFNYPLLAHIRQREHEYMHIITNAAEWDKQKEITQHWTGITIFAEKNSSWQNEQNSTYQKKDFKTKIFATALMLAGLCIFIVSSTKYLNLLTITFGLLSLIGVIIGVVLVRTELGYQSQIVKQLCGAISKGGCEKVLKSKYAKGIFGITPADATVLYFSTQFIFYLLSPYFANLFNCLLLIAYGGAAIGVWSIYIQAIKLKQWCALCLGIVVILILQTIIAITFSYFQILTHIFLVLFLFFTLLFTLLSFILLPFKQLLKTNNINKQKLTELKKWKTDVNLFITQWQQELHVDTAIWQNDLVLGNPNAPILITVACNPYCGPCSKAHKELDNLLHRFRGKVKVRIRLLCDAENEGDKRTIAVKAILQKTGIINSNYELQEMLANWFEWMDFEKWAAKWRPDNNVDVTERLQQLTTWIEQSSIKFTPTFFINGNKLPSRYNLEDVEILLPQLAGILIQDTEK